MSKKCIEMSYSQGYPHYPQVLCTIKKVCITRKILNIIKKYKKLQKNIIVLKKLQKYTK